MRTIPVQCRARFVVIMEIAGELQESFINGNRNTVRDELLDLEPRVALAVLTVMMNRASEEGRTFMVNYFTEVA